MLLQHLKPPYIVPLHFITIRFFSVLLSSIVNENRPPTNACTNVNSVLKLWTGGGLESVSFGATTGMVQLTMSLKKAMRSRENALTNLETG